MRGLERRMKRDISARTTSKRTSPTSVEDYFESIPEEARNALGGLLKTIRGIVPDGVEVISYQIPTIKYKGRGLVALSAHKNHCSFHLMSKAVMDEYKDELKLFDTTKASIHFTSAKPIPSALVKKLIMARIEENEKRESWKKK